MKVKNKDSVFCSTRCASNYTWFFHNRTILTSEQRTADQRGDIISEMLAQSPSISTKELMKLTKLSRIRIYQIIQEKRLRPKRKYKKIPEFTRHDRNTPV